MKHLYLIAITLFLFGNANAQKTDLLKDKILVGDVKGESIDVLPNSKSFLEAMNEQFPRREYDKIEIKRGQTLGDKTIAFYYIEVSSTSSNETMVRWLNAIDDKLYIENARGRKVSYKDFYVACRGVEECTPHLVADGKKMYWTCGGSLGCLTEEQSKLRPCAKETSLVTLSDL